jgi:hypothetical protein
VPKSSVISGVSTPEMGEIVSQGIYKVAEKQMTNGRMDFC